MRAVLYFRVSSEEQAKEGFSLPAQLKLLKDYGRAHDLQIVSEFLDVETAKKVGRGQFSEMVAYLGAHPNIGALLVEKTDRLYRNLKDWVTVDDCIQAGLEVHLVKENEVLRKEWVQEEVPEIP